LARYADFQTNKFLRDVPGGNPQIDAPSQLWRMHLNPQTAQVTKSWMLSDRPCEFPIVNPRQVGQAHRYSYMAVRSDRSTGTDLFDGIGCYDHARDVMTLADLGDQHYPSEPIFAPDPQNSDRGWILTVVYDANQQSSEVWILDSQGLDAAPICRLALPQTVAFGFHGTWRAA
jgi:all-trans-8'-apo-beta-carotenal 15,15'-oxygenase